jgi:cytochrome c biogenesis protein CcdA/thiol-disulfide isomerase/thioredoxin
MLLLIIFAFLAGVVTILSPCILPLLPIILSSSADPSGKKRPLGVVLGFIASFTFFTLFLSAIVGLIGISADSLRIFSIAVLVIFGLSLLIPQIQFIIEKLFTSLSRLAPNNSQRSGFKGGFVIGLSLGLLWTPCVGPILASVISLALSGSVTFQAAIITFSYSLGTAIPMFLIMQAGSTALQRVPWLTKNTGKIQKLFGVLMIVTAVGIFFNIERRFQSYILQTFPNYGVGLTKFEDNEKVKEVLQRIQNQSFDASQIGKSMSDITNAKRKAPEIIPGGQWLNSAPLALSSLKGRVVLIDFWTYSCINCQRTLPYLKNWWEKYEESGLVIIGVHSPEFEFEKNVANLRTAISDFSLPYPIVQDNNFATWRAFNNRYWPAKYLIDKDGYIRYTHFGEGAYDETEKEIQKLLKETGTEVNETVQNPYYELFSETPEIYLGSLRSTADQSIELTHKINDKKSFRFPDRLPQNTFALRGNWVIKEEYIEGSEGDEIVLHYNSKEVFLVAKSDSKAKVVFGFYDEFINQPLNGVDALMPVDSPKLYHIVTGSEKQDSILHMRVEEGTVQFYTFTFG